MPNHVSDDLKLRAVQHYIASLNYAATARYLYGATNFLEKMG